MFPVVKKEEEEENSQLERNDGKPVLSKIFDGDPIPKVLKKCKFGEGKIFLFVCFCLQYVQK